MNWLLTENSDNSHLMILIFEIANMISGIILLLTTSVLIYFLWKKNLGISDPVIVVVTSAIFLLGIKKLMTISNHKWSAYPSYCTLVDVGIASTLLILIWLLLSLVLRLLAAASPEELLVGLNEETKSKITAQDSAMSLEIRNSELQSVIFRFDTILNVQHHPGDPMDTLAALRNVISSSGAPHRGD